MAEKAADDQVSQGALVVSCSTKTAEQLIKLIIDVDPIADNVRIAKRFGTHRVLCYPWHITTKYYEADIHLFEVDSRDLISEAFADVVNAVIIYFDIRESSFQEVKYWLPFIEKFAPQVKILVCDTASDDSGEPLVYFALLTPRVTAIKRDTILQWCIANGFELVELCPQLAAEDDDDEVDDEFKETVGVKRIVEALCAHTWPSMTFKPDHVYKPSPKFVEELQREELKIESSCIESQFSALNVDDSFNDGNCEASFEALFSQFEDMKTKAQQLSGEERRLYAEKVTVAFWKALGGDEEEIAGLESD